MNMFTANKRYTEKEILAQIFYPYGSDIIYTLDELNLLRIWTGMAGLHLVLKSSVSGDSIENFQSKTNSGRSYIVLVKTKKDIVLEHILLLTLNRMNMRKLS